uniref:Ral GTPase-activating protein subunit beta n=1 Tax=Phallusia mammillata TaxID=59560 RepID=A0A6F9DQM5_9ASCI|nr:ral GTPase-activating protein subunit beta [Phallusia mammillata]
MYAEWPSIEKEVLDLEKCRSVLHSYPSFVGRDVARSVVLSLSTPATGHTMSLGHNPMPHILSTDTQVKWTMEVVCFGLSLTLSEIETIKACVQLYLDWLTVVTVPKQNIPLPIQREPLPYVQKMICHLENLFMPRSEGGSSNQLGLCNTVLKTIQSLSHDGKGFDRATWEAVLKFVIKVCDTILAPPSQPNGFSEQLCEQLMQTFYDVWMLSCTRCFPTPSLWKTARELMSHWRHHPPVVDWWSRISSALTSRLLTFLYGPDFPSYKVSEEDMKFIPKEMNNEVVAQTWFRVLHIISDPVELSNTNFITKADKFMELALKGEGFDPSLRMLPYIFLKAMKGVSSIVDAFLGLSNQRKYEVTYPHILLQISTPITPTNARKSGKAKKGATSAAFSRPPASPGASTTSPSSSTSSITPPSASANAGSISSLDMRPRPAPQRPQCNSVLHLFGEWLFDAALAGCKFEQIYGKEKGTEGRARSTSIPYSTSGSLLNAPSTDNLVSNPMFDGSEFPESSDAGRAEACATLCRIIMCKKTGEHILPVYLSRFYLVMSQGLRGDSKQVLASILLNSVDLMRLDLPGITCLLPPLLAALESILPDKELQQFKPYLNVTELRRASTHLLISMMPLALHYTTLQVADIVEQWAGPNLNVNPTSRVTFQSMKKRLLDLLIGTLQCESDAINTQMILGALLLALHDSALFEAVGDTLTSRDGKMAGVVQPTENENVPVDTAYGLFVQIVHLVSQKLDTWKSDVSISLAALELLSGLAQAPVNLQDRHECRRAVHELCQYIVHQCERPPPQHKRELHSMIVTAFHTLANWLLEHPYLMDDKDCLYEVLEIIELGISGSKSKPVLTGSPPVMKADKEISPVSMRVMEAAESLLLLVFEHLGAFPSPCSPSASCSLLDECSLVQYADGIEDTLNGSVDMNKAVRSFRYFGLHNGLLLGILEQNLQNEQEPVPTVTIVIRGPSGRKVWTMQLRQTPRKDPLSSSAYLSRPDRPPPNEMTEAYKRAKHRTFPEEVDRIPLVQADCSIPLLTDVPNAEQAARIEVLRNLIELQKDYDEEIASKCRENPMQMPECLPAHPTHEFHAARLFLSHMNLLTLESVKAQPKARLGPDLVMLNASESQFAVDLEALDSIPTRNHDTVFVFYVKKGQNNIEQVLSNVNESNKVQPAFTEFLLSLGWPVDTRRHPGWCGKSTESWKLRHRQFSDQEIIDLNKDPPSAFNGEPYILYYADAMTEVAFVVPSPAPATPTHLPQIDEGFEVDGAVGNEQTKQELTLDLSAVPANTVGLTQESPTSPTSLQPNKRKTSGASRPNPQFMPDTRVALMWCESYDSFDNFPYEKLESEMNVNSESTIAQARAKDGLVVIVIHPLDSGLFRIFVHGQNGSKGGVAVPLVSGMVVSRRALGTAVRMTAMNVSRRRRLASDSYSPPHVRRKQRINELFSKYQRRCTEPEFFTSVFTDCRRNETNADSGNTLKPVPAAS